MITILSSVLSVFVSLASFPAALGVDGRLRHPWSEANGKPLAFIFVSHNCPVCNIYAPEIGRIEKAYQDKVKFYIVYSEPALSNEEARRHGKEFGIDSATLLLDPNCVFAAYCKATVTPEAVLYDSQGKRVYAGRIDDRYYALGQQRPSATTRDLANALDSVLAHRSPHPAAGAPVGCFILLPQKS